MTKVLIVDDVRSWTAYHSYIISKLLPEARITTAHSAREGYDKLLEHNNEPFDIIITDMQMETDFEPKYAGEWFVEQIKTFKNYSKTKIVIISATYNIKHIAETLGVECISKSTAGKFPNAYDFLKDN